MTEPDDVLNVKVGNEPRRLKMSYGLVTELSRLLPDPAAVADMLGSDPGLRDLVIRRVLTVGLNRASTFEDLVAAEELDITLETATDVLAFVAEHVLYFFMSSARKTAAVVEKYKDLMTLPSAPSTSGSVS